MEVVNVCREKGKKFSSPCVCVCVSVSPLFESSLCWRQQLMKYNGNELPLCLTFSERRAVLSARSDLWKNVSKLVPHFHQIGNLLPISY